VVLGEELPDGVGGVERCRWRWEVADSLRDGTRHSAGPLLVGTDGGDQPDGAAVGAAGIRMLTASTLIRRSESHRWSAYRPDGMGR
jgi:hypothetical protein